MKQRGRVLLVTLLLAGSSNAEVLPAPVQVNVSSPVLTVADAAIDAAEMTTDLALQELVVNLIIPVQGVVATDLRSDFHDKRGKHRQHDALDIMAPRGTPVLSATAGRVLQLMKNSNGGLMVFAADATERFILFYAHLDDYADNLKEGMPLRQGQVIGYVGTTGNAPRRTPHLHFAIKRTGKSLRWTRGTPIDPFPLLQSSPTAVGLADEVQTQSN